MAVAAFLDGHIRFTEIGDIVRRALDAIPTEAVTSFDDLFAADRAAREHCRGQLEATA
jgi:1-deoxy-D-xylulose-5-phosphate reductoisomerase